jgi:hypothetical protein
MDRHQIQRTVLSRKVIQVERQPTETHRSSFVAFSTLQPPNEPIDGTHRKERVEHFRVGATALRLLPNGAHKVLGALRESEH